MVSSHVTSSHPHQCLTYNSLAWRLRLLSEDGADSSEPLLALEPAYSRFIFWEFATDLLYSLVAPYLYGSGQYAHSRPSSYFGLVLPFLALQTISRWAFCVWAYLTDSMALWFFWQLRWIFNQRFVGRENMGGVHSRVTSKQTWNRIALFLGASRIQSLQWGVAVIWYYHIRR